MWFNLMKFAPDTPDVPGLRPHAPGERTRPSRQRSAPPKPELDPQTRPVRRRADKESKRIRKHPYSIRLGTKTVDLLRRIGRGQLTYGIENAAAFVEVLLSLEADWPQWIEEARKRQPRDHDDEDDDAEE